MPIIEGKNAAEIEWFNKENVAIKDQLISWLRELGHETETTENTATREEEISGEYDVKEYTIKIDKSLQIQIKPYGIWIIGAKGRIDIHGPSGYEKIVYFLPGGPVPETEIKTGDKAIKKSTKAYFKTVDSEGWYWYDDSSYRKVAKFSKEIIEPLLERLQ
ncbi:MAG: hypothetical protein WCQ50_20525 [Spirochaetota bacterium]